MMGGLVRIGSCLLLWGIGAQALGGGPVGVVVSAVVAFSVNRLWRLQQAADRRAAIVADEQLRLEVRERRRDEGRA
jgi:hypothetical protein